MKRVAPSGRLTGPQHYWAVMQALSADGGSFAIPDVYGMTNGVSPRTVKDYILRCASLGAIQKTGTLPTVKNRFACLYRVNPAVREAPVIRRTVYRDDRGRRQQQLWTAIRVLRSFTVAELAVTASTDTVQVDQRMARYYVCALARSGMIAEISHRTARGQPGTWKLMPSANTGPRAPAVTKAGVIDRNLTPLVKVTRRAA